jgi:hypothetical protein
VYLDVYIARLADALVDPSDPSAALRTPRRWSDCFPGGRGPYHALHAAVDDGEWDAIQTDWGAIVVPLDKAAISSLLERTYTPDVESGLAAHQRVILRNLREFVDRLEEGVRYAVVAAEL